MTKEELEAIRQRVFAPTSLGYAYTHYKSDVTKLLEYINELESDIEERDSMAEDRRF